MTASSSHAKGPEACQLARRINEQLADIASKHPTRFGAMATLPALATTDGLLEEMAYALDTLKLDGVATTTSIDDIYLGDTRYDPWFDEMNRRGVTLFVHPVAAKASRSVDLGIDVSLLEFMFDTTRMLTNMIFSGAKKRFSKIKIISTHGGGTIPYLTTRIETLEKVFGPGKFLLRPYRGNISRAALRSTEDGAALPPGDGLRQSVHAGMDVSTCHSGYAALERL